MTQEYDIKAMAEKVSALRQTAEELKKMSGGIPAVDCNADRILANVRMLEIGINEAAELVD
jgi:hypothetical protein